MSLSKKQIDYLCTSSHSFNLSSGSVSSGKTFIQVLRWFKHIYDVPKNSLLLMSGKTSESLYDNVIRDLVSLRPGDIKHQRSPQRVKVLSKNIEIACADASNESSWGKIQGKTVFGWLADEVTRHPSNFVKMAQSRCRGQGQVWPKFWTCNPENSEHYIRKDYILNKKLDLKLWEFTFDDNPVLSREYKQELKNSYSGVFYDRFILGKWVNAEGVVYPDFNQDVHVIAPISPPKDYLVYRAIDFGFKNPFVCLFGFVDNDNRIIIYDEHYEAERLLEYHAEKIKQRGRLDSYTISDHDAQDRHELDNLGIPSDPAKKDVIIGLQSVQKRLKIQADGKPRLFICANCVNTIREFKIYEWDEPKEGKVNKEEPKKINDHAMDALRYLVMAIDFGGGGIDWA